MNSKRTALVVGASGLTGRHLLTFLLNDPDYQKIFIFSRQPLPVKNEKLVQKITAFDQGTVDKNLFTVHDVFCCLGTTIKKAGSQQTFREVDLTLVMHLAQMASHQGAKNFLYVSTLGADPVSKIFYLKTKGETEIELMKLKFHSLHFFRPSLLIGNRKEFRFGEKIALILSKLFFFLYVWPLKKYQPIKAKHLAQAMWQAAKKDMAGVFIYESDKIKNFLKK